MNQYFKLAILLFFTLATESISAQSIRKIIETPLQTIESKWELRTEGGSELNYYNEDCCDYYLFRENDRSYNLSPGKNTIFRIEKNSQVGDTFKSSSRYMYFRGQFLKDFQVDRPYALPIKNGNEVVWKIDPQERMKTMNFTIDKGDTIYATRGGVACKTVLPQHLLIYHSDHTFAAYLMMSENFIAPGERIQVNQPIGIAGILGVSISYFFLDSNKFNAGGAIGYPYSHFTPVFRTDKGDLKLIEKTSYKALIDDGLVMQEMNKREQKKYLKQKNSK